VLTVCPAELCSSDDTLTGGERLYLSDAFGFAERAYSLELIA